MGRWLTRTGLPLLTKELIEQSARSRTWFIRAGYLGLLFLFFLTNAAAYWDARDVRAMLGSGGRLFDMLVGFQFFGVYLLVPLSTFGLITSEKERDSLQLLLLTRLGPWTILLEKLLSRLVPLMLFLLASMPLLAVSYSYGGVSTPMLANAVLCLFCSAFFLACIGLLFSTFANTSTQAFFGTLAGGALIIFTPLLTALLLYEIFDVRIRELWFVYDDDWFFGMFMGPVVFYEDSGKSFLDCLWWNLPQLGVGIVSLVLSRVLLPRRAFAGKSGVARQTRAVVDRVSRKFLNRLPHQDLPDVTPISWLERRQGLTGRPVYLAALFGVLGILLLIGSVIAASERDLDEFSAFCHGMLWVVAPLMICGKGAGLFGTERSRQTLDVLLTTPLTSKDIVRQKMSGIWPLIFFLLCLFATMAVMSLAAAVTRSRNTQPLPLAFLATIVTPAVYLPMIAWMSAAISLRTKTAARATIYSVVGLAAWCTGPFVFCIMCMMASNGGPGGSEEAFFAGVGPLLSPAFFPIMCVISFFDDDPLEDYFIVSLVWNTAVYGGALVMFRMYCLENASDAMDRPDRDLSHLPVTPVQADPRIRVERPESSE